MPDAVSRAVEAVMTDVVETRRAIHRSPELSGVEFATTALVADRLRSAGLTPRLRTPKPGLTVDLGTGDRLVGYRADLDALPIQEPAGLGFASEVPGVMHACGHDAHTAMAVGVALVLAELDLAGRVRVIFQPAEESFPGGAFDMAREGVVEGMSGIVALHVDPTLPPGVIGARSGAITSSADRFYITLEGPGGHTARPHQTVDLVYALGKVISDLPALLDRKLDARAPVALVFGRAAAGTADNVIPTHAELSGTLRTADREVWESIPTLLQRLVNDITAPLGATVLMHYQRGIPPVINDPDVMRTIERALSDALGPEAIRPTHVSMGAEDFARYLEDVPGALLRLGCRVEDEPPVDLHSAGFRLDERCLATGVHAGVSAVLALLEA